MANPNPSPENRFSKGQSGNPSGRPKGSSLGAALRDYLDGEATIKGKEPGHGITRRDALVRKLFREAIQSGDAALMRLIFDRHDGKTPDAPEESQDGRAGGKILKTPGSRRRRDGDGG